MRIVRSIGQLALVAAALLAGCGKSDSAQRLQLDSFVAKAADEVCSALARCACTDASAVTTCRQAYVSDMTDGLDYLLLEYPGQTLDPAAARQCLDDIKAELSDCSLSPGVANMPTLVVGKAGPSFLMPSCEDIFKGVQTAGERCHVDGECAAGLACDRSTLTCATPPGVEGDCSAISCDDTSWCYDGTCFAKGGAEDSCDYAGDAACEAGLSCYYSYDQEGWFCGTPVAIDGTCGDGTPCVTGAYCDGSSTCVALIADAAECGADYQCEHQWCNAQGVCEDPGICSLSSSPK